MLGDINQEFPRRLKQDNIHFLRQAGVYLIAGDIYVDSGALLVTFSKPLDCRLKPQFIQYRGADFKNQGTGFLKRIIE